MLRSPRPLSRRDWLRRSAAAAAGAALAPVASALPVSALPTSARPVAAAPTQWGATDLDVTDFESLRANVYAFEAAHPRGPFFWLHEMLGDYPAVLADADRSLPQTQLPNGLFPAAVDGILFKRRFLDVTHDLLIRQRGGIADSIYLQTVPPHRFAYLEPMLADTAAVETWLDTLPWHDPWSCGNLTMDLAYALLAAWKLHGDERAREALDVWFAWHDREADPDHGFWDPRVVGSLYRAMAGGMHQFGIYFMMGREVPYPEAALRATLRLQNGYGLFAQEHPSHNSSDIDGVFVIANLYNRYGFAETEVKASMERVLAATLPLFHPAGGGINRLGMDTEPDPWSTWVRTACVGWAARILDVEAFAGPWELDSHRHPFMSEDAGLGVPDPASEAWYDAVGWPRPA